MGCMQRTSTTVIATVGGDAALLAHLGTTSNVRAVITEGDGSPLDRAASAWAVAARTTTPYLVHDADPLAAVAEAWTRRFDGLAPHGELELAVSETLARWRARRLELPDYYLLVEPREWPATRRHWFLGFLAGLAPTRVLVADAPVLTTLPRLPTGRWWPELDQLVDGIDRIAPDKAGLPAGGVVTGADRPTALVL
jgi:hypothetical protein